MRILVYPHDLEIGGSQINAIEMAARSRDLGHDVIVYGRPGALVDKIHDLGLEFVASPRPGRRPSPDVVRHLSEIVASRKLDVVHGYEWPPALEACLATRGGRRATPIATVMSMAIAPFIPRDLPLVVGTEQIADHERQLGRSNTHVLEPPVDLSSNDPSQVVGAAEFRARWADPDEIVVVSVTRLAHELKLEGILSAIDTIGDLAQQYRVVLLLVGDGPARSEVTAAADRVNAAIGRPVIKLVGQLDDPRPAYAGGDIQMAMGGSALRSMAFARPLIVQGEQGFFEVASPDTVHLFEWSGWYGVGSGVESGSALLKSKLEPLLSDRDLRERLGNFGRSYVSSRFGLDAATVHQLSIYEEICAARPRLGGASTLRAVAQLGHYYGDRLLRKLRRRSSMDDFNSTPVAALDRAGRRV